MVFWQNYPILDMLIGKLNRKKFIELIFDRDPIKSPTEVDAIVINSSNKKRLEDIRIFIKTHFGNPPKTPILDIPVESILGEKDHILYVTDIYNEIIGCIRYHYIGKFISDNNQEMYCEDCFCIDPKWRKKGIGDYLLTKLHIYINKNNMPFSLFLKEGQRLNILHSPFYSAMYVYKKTEYNKILINTIYDLSIDTAYKIIDIFREFNPNLFIILNKKLKNQIWKIYKKEKYIILVCFQNTYQTFEEDNKNQRIGWATAWIESPNITDTIRKEASIILSDSMVHIFDYIWINKSWTGNNTTVWKTDGPFHWYLYQWSTTINIKNNYCILN